MIIDTSIITQLALGVDRRIPEIGDIQTIIPNVIQPTLEPLSPHVFDPGTSINNVTSVGKSSINTFNNSAGSSFAFVRLAKGLWRLDWKVALQFDFTGVGGLTDEFTIKFVNAVTSVNHIIYGRFAQIGSTIDIWSDVYLFTEDQLIQFVTPTTGVTENIQNRIVLNAKKIL